MTPTPRKKLSTVTGPQPSILSIRDTLALARTDYVAKDWGVTDLALRTFLRRMEVPLLHIGDTAYFDWYALEIIFHALLRPGQHGLKFPRSACRIRTSALSRLSLADPTLQNLILDPPPSLHAELAMRSLAALGRTREEVEDRLLLMAKYLLGGEARRTLKQSAASKKRRTTPKKDA